MGSGLILLGEVVVPQCGPERMLKDPAERVLKERLKNKIRAR